MTSESPLPFIFIHIPKCAGTSIELALMRTCLGVQNWKELGPHRAAVHCLPQSGRQHNKLRWFSKHGFPIERYFKFALVRNPWHRAISQIRYLKKNTGTQLFKGDTLKQNVEILCNTTRWIWGQDLGAQQCDYLRGANGDLEMDFIGRFESLHQDFNTICVRLGIQTPELPHIFRSEVANRYANDLDRESIELIRRKYADDVRLFGYDYDIANTLAT